MQLVGVKLVTEAMEEVAIMRQSKKITLLSVAFCMIQFSNYMLVCNSQLVANSNQKQVYNNQIKQTNHLRQQYQAPNLTSTNRPIERPNLPTLSSNQQQFQNISSHLPESSADWLMLGEDLMTNEGKNIASFAEMSKSKNATMKRSGFKSKKLSNKNTSANKTIFDDEQFESTDANEVVEEGDEGPGLAGNQKEPECASHGRYYCTYKEDYPLKLVTEVTKYYKWPLEKLFRDLHAQIMPKLAQDSTGNLVCDSITRVVRPGWARNTNDRWLVVINTDNYHQYVTEVVCQYGTNSRCNFIPPCYYSSCQQRYNTQKLLVIDPTNPYRGPFLSEFLFPSCCVCYVPSASDTFQDKYRSSPATIYQRTMQQEATNNLNPSQVRPVLMEDLGSVMNEQATRVSASTSFSSKQTSANHAAGPGEIRRGGEEFRQANEDQDKGNEYSNFPRLGLADSLVNPGQSSSDGERH